jgi:thiosulfate dehydrogenase
MPGEAGKREACGMAQKRTGWLAALIIAGVAFGSGQACAQQLDTAQSGPDELGPVFLISLGGKLYDDLWTVTELPPPDGANPAYPANPQIADRDTWRCVSCHGWDYKGSGGERGVAVPDLKAPGLTALSGTDPERIIELIRAPSHPFPSDQLPELAGELIAAFLSGGQRDIGEFAGGDPEAGQGIFEGACTNCHQIDGRRYLRGEPGDRSSLGWRVRNRPEQSLHKILNGVPAAEMLSLHFMPDWQIADLLAYVVTLDLPQQ